MIKLFDGGAWLIHGTEVVPEQEEKKAEALAGHALSKKEGQKGTIAYSILKQHNTAPDMDHLKIKFDAMASHDITFVGIIQTAKASGMTKFPLPYVMTNCHNSLCAVGGTINEDDHLFGLSAAKKYGGIYVPPHIAVIHQYMREKMAGCGRMILGSDSHTRYGALGTMAMGEGGGELVKQLLCDTYDIAYPGVVGVYLTGRPRPGVGPHDIAIAIVGAVFKNGYVKNKVMEFIGPGVASMTTDYRNSVDVMTTETTCLSSVWRTDDDTKAYLTQHGRPDAYKELNPADVAYYDGFVEVNLSTIKPMIALPFHPSNAYEIDEFNQNAGDILREAEKRAQELIGDRDIPFSLTDKLVDGRLHVQQGVIAGCAGGNYVNVMAAAHILKNASCGNGVFSLDVYPSSQPVYMDLVKKGAVSELLAAVLSLRRLFVVPALVLVIHRPITRSASVIRRGISRTVKAASPVRDSSLLWHSWMPVLLRRRLPMAVSSPLRKPMLMITKYRLMTMMTAPMQPVYTTDLAKQKPVQISFMGRISKTGRIWNHWPMISSSGYVPKSPMPSRRQTN